jgi:hypothetical protein
LILLISACQLFSFLIGFQRVSVSAFSFCFCRFPWPVKSLGLWNQFVIPAGRLLHWAAFDFDLLPASQAIVEC